MLEYDQRLVVLVFILLVFVIFAPVALFNWHRWRTQAVFYASAVEEYENISLLRGQQTVDLIQDTAVFDQIPEVKRVLQISTAHLPEIYGNINSGWCLVNLLDRFGVIAYETEFGYLMLVRHPHYIHELKVEAVPEEIRRVEDFARDLGCTWVFFDRDADIIGDLPMYEW